MKTPASILLTIFSLFQLPANAYHIAGGSMTYKCIGQDSFEVSLEIIRDCSSPLAAPFDNPAYVAVYDTSRNLIGDAYEVLFNGSQGIDSMIICPGNGVLICSQKTTYTLLLVNSMRAGGINVVYQRC